MGRLGPTLNDEEVDEIFDTLIQKRSRSIAAKLAKAGKLPAFMKKFEEQTKEINKSRLANGHDPISHLERFKYTKSLHLRGDQIFEPTKRVTIISCGRGFGKTHMMACKIIELAERYPGIRIGLFSMSLDDAVDIMINGPSGIMENSPPWNQPTWIASRGRGQLHWANGSVAFVMGTTNVPMMRGQQLDISILDEVCFWKSPSPAFDKVEMMTRSERFFSPKLIITTTPDDTNKSDSLLDDLSKRKDTEEIFGATYENYYLGDDYVKSMIRKFWGTSMWDMEIEGRRVKHKDGALFSVELIDENRAERPKRSDIDYMIASFDPATETTKKSEHGLVIGGALNGQAYIVADSTTSGDADDVAEHIVDELIRWKVDLLMIERNAGGDWVEKFVKRIIKERKEKGLPYPRTRINSKWVANRSKYDRARAIRPFYQSGIVHHCGQFRALEDQMRSFEGKRGEKSPDRLDALVHLVTELCEVSDDRNKKFRKRKPRYRINGRMISAKSVVDEAAKKKGDSAKHEHRQ